MTTALYYLRAKQVGLSLEEMCEISEGLVVDMIIEKGNDNCSDLYREVATQKDFDSF